MKKRAVALACVLVSLLLMLAPWTAAAGPYDGVYLLGVNDTVMLNFISADLMPVRRGGTIFAPCSLLDNKDLGLSYALNRTDGTFTVFDRKQTLIFYLSRSMAEDKDGNTYYDQRAITRNGVVFFPLRFVASYFGLTCSSYNLMLPEGAVPIVRVCTDQPSLPDDQFRLSAASLVAEPLRQYMSARASQAATPTPSQTPPAVESPPPAPSVPPAQVTLSLAVACVDGGGFQTLLDAFASARYPALFLFPPDDLVARDADVRAAAVAGHQIGLLLGPDTPEEDFRRGNELLAHILRAETNQVAFRSGSPQEGNWWVWRGNVSPRGGGVSSQAENLASDVNAHTTARVTLNDSLTTARALQRNIRAWSRQPYTLVSVTGS